MCDVIVFSKAQMDSLSSWTSPRKINREVYWLAPCYVHLGHQVPMGGSPKGVCRIPKWLLGVKDKMIRKEPAAEADCWQLPNRHTQLVATVAMVLYKLSLQMNVTKVVLCKKKQLHIVKTITSNSSIQLAYIYLFFLQVRFDKFFNLKEVIK